MANIIIGYRNFVVTESPTITPNHESPGFDADNLAIPHPAEFWRYTTLANGSVDFNFGTSPSRYTLFCPLYVSASPYRNLLQETLRPAANPTEWARTGLTDITETGYADELPSITETARIQTMDEDSSAGNHHVQQTYTVDWVRTSEPAYEFVAALVVSNNTATSRNLRCRVFNGSDYVQIEVSHATSTPAVQDASNGGSWASGGYDLSRLGTTNYWLLKFSGSITTEPSTIVYRISCLDGTSDSYTGSGAAGPDVVFAAPFLALGSTSSASTQNLLDDLFSLDVNDTQISGPVYQVLVSDSPTFATNRWLSAGRPLASSNTVRTWSDARGWVHGFPTVLEEASLSGNPPGNRQYCRIRIYDPDNADSQVDMSNVYIGPHWQPTRNIAFDIDWGVDQFGRRMLSFSFGFATEQDAFVEAMNLANIAGISADQASTASGGQEYRAGKHPVLFIIDPDEEVFGQEQILYGFVDSLEIGGKGWFSSESANLYKIEMDVTEAVP